MVVEEIINKIDAEKMLCDFKNEKGFNFTPIYEDDYFYIDTIFGFDKFNQHPMYFRVLNGNPYSKKANSCVRINVRKCEYVTYDNECIDFISKDYLIKVLKRKCYSELFMDSEHTVWECIVESLFSGVKMNKYIFKLKMKLLNKIPDYTKLTI